MPNCTPNNQNLNLLKFGSFSLSNNRLRSWFVRIYWNKKWLLNRIDSEVYIAQFDGKFYLKKVCFLCWFLNLLKDLDLLEDLETNRENRPFLDRIYHQIAQYKLQNQSDSIAISYFNKSLRTNSEDDYLTAKNYQILGDLNFDYSEYSLACQTVLRIIKI